MKPIYNGSDQHISNARNAAKQASAKRLCIHCEKPFSLGNLATHEPVCLYSDNNSIFCKCCSSRIYEREKQFCNRSCAATYNNKLHSDDSRKRQAAKVSKTMRGRPSPKKGKTQRKDKVDSTVKLTDPITGKIAEIRKCVSCSAEFLHAKHKKRTTCSSRCKSLLLAQKAGDRETVWSRQKIIPFLCLSTGQMVNLQSTWEIITAQMLDDLLIEWVRPKSIIWEDCNKKARRYYADFYLPAFDVYLDPKNPWVMQKDQDKIEKVSRIVSLLVGTPDEIIKKVVSMTGSAPAISRPPDERIN